MRIALVILHADPSRGGAERYTIDLAHGLRGRGHEVKLLASTFAGDVAEEMRVSLDASGSTRLARYRRFLDALDGHLKQTTYDVVHAMLPVRQCDFYHPHAGLAAEAIASGHRKRDWVVTRALSCMANRLNARRMEFARVERQLLTQHRPPAVLCLSDLIKATVRKHYSLPEGRLAKLFNATDLDRFDPAKHPEAREELRRKWEVKSDQVVALIIAQDFVRKGVREAILAMDPADPRLVLIVVGKQDPAPFERLAQSRGLEDRVRFVGATDRPDDHYRAADFFVLPTRHDPCSLVVLEALAMGLPVISTRFNGACEIMTDGKHGYVLSDPADIENLNRAMKAMHDGDRRDAMSEACLALRPTLSFEHHLDELLRLYSRPLAK